MTKPAAVLMLIASLTVSACTGTSDSASTTAKDSLAPRTKNAALPTTTAPVATTTSTPATTTSTPVATTTAPVASTMTTLITATTAQGSKRRETLGSFDKRNFIFTFNRPIPRLAITWYADDGKWPTLSEYRNITSLAPMNDVAFRSVDMTWVKFDFFFGTTKITDVLVSLGHEHLTKTSPCKFTQDGNDIMSCAPMASVVYEWFNNFRAIGNPITLNLPANSPTSTINFAKLGVPDGATRVKARITLAGAGIGGKTVLEDMYFPVYTVGPNADYIITSRKDTIYPRLTK